MDRLLGEATTGPTYLNQHAIAQMIVEAVHFNSRVLRHYELHSYVVMPNHVHLIVTPAVPVPKLTRSLKSITAKRANQLLGLTGQGFWQDETYDRVVRNTLEFERIRAYIEANPVAAGLVREREEFPWSSAWKHEPAGGPPAGQGARPPGLL